MNDHDVITKEIVEMVNKKVMCGLGGVDGYRDKGKTEGKTTYIAPEKIHERLQSLLSFLKDAWPKTESFIERLVLATFFLERFLLIHPFKNGNGRTVRLLFSFLLSVPVCFFLLERNGNVVGIKDIRQEYYDCLDRSRTQPPRPNFLCRFVLESTRLHLDKIFDSYC